LAINGYTMPAMKRYIYCPMCRGRLKKIKIDDNYRQVCGKCGWRHYSNPVPAVAAFVQNAHGEILLIKRGLEPGKGKWALPSGFIEYDEIPEHTVLRELKEETNIRGKIERLLGVHIEKTSVYGNIILTGYDISFTGGKPVAGSDSVEAEFFPKDKLPYIPFVSHRAIIREGLSDRPASTVFIEVLKSKITEAFVTGTVLHYNGSMGIDERVLRAANILPGEKVHVLNYNNAERLETYTIAEKAGSGRFVMYGPASLKGKVGHKLCILAYARVDPDLAKRTKPSIVVLSNKNKTIQMQHS